MTRSIPAPSIASAPRPASRRRCLLGLLLIASLAGCGWKNNSADVGERAIPVSKLDPAERAGAVSGRLQYVLQPGDELDVKFFYNPELNESLVIRPDGGISLQLVDDVQAAGMAPAELREHLKELYAPTLRRPEVAVILRKYGSQKVFVSGEVANPGVVVLEAARPLSALQAIMSTGGFRPSAARSSVVVLRQDAGAEARFIKLDLQAHLEQKSREDILLRPFDIVYVPQIEIGEVAQFFELYVNRIVPIYRNLGFSFTYGLGNNARVSPP